MAYARVVTFEGADQSGIDEITKAVDEGERPEGVPATEIVVLADPDRGKLQVLTFFDTEEDYRQGDATLQAMNPAPGMGSRASVEKYEVTVRRTA